MSDRRPVLDHGVLHHGIHRVDVRGQQSPAVHLQLPAVLRAGQRTCQRTCRVDARMYGVLASINLEEGLPTCKWHDALGALHCLALDLLLLE